ncbi:MAG: dephospho-CoA kinase [Candidatus Omnitrophota bacterium]
MKTRLKDRKRLVIGLTGCFGSGKTTVAAMLHAYGARVIDADAIGHRLLQKGTGVYSSIVRRFGSGILAGDKTIDRRALAGVVFASRARLQQLNKIIHPEIIRIIKNEIAKVRKGVVVLDAPLLVETGFQRYVDRLVVVESDRKRLICRIQARTSLSKAAILRRIRVQIPLQDKVRMADFVIDNNGTRKDLRKQVAVIRRMWWTS